MSYLPIHTHSIQAFLPNVHTLNALGVTWVSVSYPRILQHARNRTTSLPVSRWSTVHNRLKLTAATIPRWSPIQVLTQLYFDSEIWWDQVCSGWYGWKPVSVPGATICSQSACSLNTARECDLTVKPHAHWLLTCQSQVIKLIWKVFT